MALVADDCLIPTRDAPELGYVKESTNEQYVPDVFYKVPTVRSYCLLALTLLVGRQEEHPACKKWEDGGGGHWLVRMEWRLAGWSVCICLC